MRPSRASSSSSNQDTMDGKRLAYRSYFERSPEGALVRKKYLRVFVGGSFGTILLIFSVFSLFWGSLWHTPAHALPGWIIDFDQGAIGATVVQALSTQSPGSKISWTVIPASQFSGGASAVGNAVTEERTWFAITINAGASQRLAASLSTPNATYDGTEALTVFAVEARNENAFRNIIRPSVQGALDELSKMFAIQTARQVNSTQILSISPQTVVLPVSYTLVNLIPFDIPVASAVTFVGLILQLILSFFVVMMGASAREVSGLERTLTTRALVTLRLVSSFAAFLIISFFYCLLSIAFKLPVDRKFGHNGFLVFWMLTYVGMLSVGLALESLVALLTPRFIPFFMLTWVIANVSVSIFPIEIMPHFYRYGYAAPFYNISRAMRTVIFGTRNRVAFDFGVLFIWIIISCITLPLIQWWVRRSDRRVDTRTTLAAGSDLGNDGSPDEVGEKDSA